jgi:hypothetical protein
LSIFPHFLRLWRFKFLLHFAQRLNLSDDFILASGIALVRISGGSCALDYFNPYCEGQSGRRLQETELPPHQAGSPGGHHE